MLLRPPKSTFISITRSSLIEHDAPRPLPPPAHPSFTPSLVPALAMLRIDMTIKTNDFGFGFCDFAFMSMRTGHSPTPFPSLHTFHLAFSTCHALRVQLGLVSSSNPPHPTHSLLSPLGANACTIFNHSVERLAAAPDPVLVLVLLLPLVAAVCSGHCLCRRHTHIHTQRHVCPASGCDSGCSASSNSALALALALARAQAVARSGIGKGLSAGGVVGEWGGSAG